MGDMASPLITKIFGAPGARQLKKAGGLVQKANSHTDHYKGLTDEQLRDVTADFKRRLEGGESLDNLLPEAFAAVREAADRALGMRHYDVQLIGGAVLHTGAISEMRTGEGKTLVGTAPVYLNALAGKGVHVVTVNDYLARRDAGWMARVYHALGLSTGIIIHEQALLYDPEYTDETTEDDRLRHLRPVSRRQAYAADITYGTNNEFGFDYLRDNMVSDSSQMVQRELYFAIVDEVDSILIDEARTPLIISAPAQEATEKYYQFADLAAKLTPEAHYTLEEKHKSVSLTDEGVAAIEKLLGVDNVYEAGRIDEVRHIEQALKARALYLRDRDYVVRDGEVIIVDEFTGRLKPGTRWSEGLHQAVEAKERVEIRQESLTLATITYQNYFRLYSKLSGMTGTAETEAEEFGKIYNLDVVKIPTHKPMIRQDLPDRIYRSEEGKFRAVAEEVAYRHRTGQPVLLGTVSIARNELLSSYLTQMGIPHEVLNAKSNEREAAIIAEAGRRGAVTLATNIAGRGTDIVLEDGVAELGGLHVIGTERHESRRIDNQLRGRSGRQGDPGSSQFYVSLEDDLMRIFGSDRIGVIMERFGLDDSTPLEHPMVSKSLESAQKKVEGHYYDQRKHVVEYDDVMNRHREVIYNRRRRALNAESLREEMIGAAQKEAEAMLTTHTDALTGEIDGEALAASLQSIFLEGQVTAQDVTRLHPSEFSEFIRDKAQEIYDQRVSEHGEEVTRLVDRTVYLKALDGLWIEHLEAMQMLRDGIGLRQVGQRDPLVEYKREAYSMFKRLLGLLEAELATTIFRIVIAREEQHVHEPVETELTRAAQKAHLFDATGPTPIGAASASSGTPVQAGPAAASSASGRGKRKRR